MDQNKPVDIFKTFVLCNFPIIVLFILKFYTIK